MKNRYIEVFVFQPIVGSVVVPSCCSVCLAATFVGGGYIVGLTEAVYNPDMGLTWAVMPITAAVSFIVGKTGFTPSSHNIQ